MANSDKAEGGYPWRIMLVGCLCLQAVACWNGEFNVEQGEAGNFWEPLHYLLYGTGVQNFEWSKEYAIRAPVYLAPLYGFGMVGKLLGLSKLGVLYVMRYLLGACGSLSLYSMARASEGVLGGRAAAMGFWLAASNQCVALYMGRVGVDTFTSMLHCLMVAAWFKGRHVRLVWLCAATVLLRPSFLCVVGAMGLIVAQQVASSKGGGWLAVARLAGHAALAAGACTGGVLLCDSLWYGRPTLSLVNFLRFNFFDEGAENFGTMRLWFYADKLLLDNNIVLSLAGPAGAALRPRKAIYLVPSLVLLAVLCCQPHKEYRFLYPTFPTLAVFGGVFFDAVLSPTGAPWTKRDFAVALLLTAHTLNGASILTLQSHVYAPHAAFARDASAAVDARGGGTCLCTFPWCSWFLPQSCTRAYFTCVYEEFFPGYTNVTYRRFESQNETALIDVSPGGQQFTFRDWHAGTHSNSRYHEEREASHVAVEARRLHRLQSGGRNAAWGFSDPGIKAALDEVDHVFFFEISSSPHSLFRRAWAREFGGPPPRKVTHHIYSDLMLQSHLYWGSFKEVAYADTIAEPGIFNLDPHCRALFLWATSGSCTVLPYRTHTLMSKRALPPPPEQACAPPASAKGLQGS